MAHTKQTARISTGGKPPKKQPPSIAARQSRIAPAPVPMKPSLKLKTYRSATVSPKSTDAPAMELVEAFSNVGFETIRKHSGGDEGMELVESLKNMGFN